MTLLILALLPPLYLIYYVYKMDKVEREPKRLVTKVFLMGVLSVIPVLIGELIFSFVLDSLFENYNSMLYIWIDNLICVALIEEYGKYRAAKTIWKEPEFNYRFDAIVYCVAAALGFAAIENVLYVFENGFSTGILRAVLSVPSHGIDGVFMGVFFGEARYCELHDDIVGKKRNIRKALLIPILLHGVYDALLSFDHDLYLILFVLFVIAVDVYALRLLKMRSATDTSFVS